MQRRWDVSLRAWILTALVLADCKPQPAQHVPNDSAAAGSEVASAVPVEASAAIDPDGAAPDAATPDAATSDGATPDAATSEGGSPDSGVTASQRAEDCLASPLCAAEEAARLFIAAADAREPGLDCLRFLDGAGTPRDLARGRACLERQADALDCAGSSMSLEAAELALLRIDGIGGAADVAAAREFVRGCFDDVTREGVLDHATAKEHDPKTPRVDFCKDIGGTTITNNECEGRSGKNADTRRQLQAKAVVAGLDDAGRDLFGRSEQAYADYVSAVGDYVYEVYIDGTIRGSMALAAQNKLKAKRIQDLVAFPRFVAKDTTAKDVEAAERARSAAIERVHPEKDAEKTALLKTQQTWEIYREAEVALYGHVFGPAQGAERVASAVRAKLEHRRASEVAIAE